MLAAGALVRALDSTSEMLYRVQNRINVKEVRRDRT
jgi:hypothetical protein